MSLVTCRCNASLVRVGGTPSPEATALPGEGVHPPRAAPPLGGWAGLLGWLNGLQRGWTAGRSGLGGVGAGGLADGTRTPGVRYPSLCCLATAHGRLPEWPKGAVCKTVGLAYVGSNPTPATTCGNGP